MRVCEKKINSNFFNKKTLKLKMDLYNGEKIIDRLLGIKRQLN